MVTGHIKINHLLAADHDLSKIDPANDHIWQVSSETGEPPALAVYSTYGLRAFNMRVFPRFQHNRISVTDPEAFFEYPSIEYSAPNFIHLHFLPFNFIDVDLRVWVPTSQVIVGQATINLKTNQPEVLTMEWVAMLTPFAGGSTMTAMEYSINTILAGKSRNLEPVFLMTGAPRADLSANPGLGVNLSLRPGTPRQFTWVLATLENRDISFYAARKYSASLLEAEQLKIEMTRRKRSLVIDTHNTAVNARIHQSQNRMEQLILPAFGKFRNETYVQSRSTDHGYSHSNDASDSGPNWGIQTSTEAWLASRLLLPARTDFIKGIVMNFIDQQAANGSIDMLTAWSGKRTGKLCTPLLASLTADLNPYLQDNEWLGIVYPSLLRNLQEWFRDISGEDETGFPKWAHPLQLGFSSSSHPRDAESQDWYTFVRTTESPALAALLFRECESLVSIALKLGQTENMNWLEKISAQLKSLVQDCWDEKNARFQNRDRVNHSSSKAVKAIRYRRNGSFQIDAAKSSSSFTIVKINFGKESVHPVSIELVFSNRKKILLSEKDFEWSLISGTAVLDRPLRNLRLVTLNGLKSNELVVISEPDYESFDPTMIIPFWAGIASTEQNTKFFTKHINLFESPGTLHYPLPAYLRVMLLETLNRNGLDKEAMRLFNTWYLEDQQQDPVIAPGSMTPAKKTYTVIEELIPIHTFLHLRGISNWTQNAVTIENLNQHPVPITVQYGQTVLELSSEACIVKHENGEAFTITQPGRYEILRS